MWKEWQVGSSLLRSVLVSQYLLSLFWLFFMKSPFWFCSAQYKRRVNEGREEQGSGRRKNWETHGVRVNWNQPPTTTSRIQPHAPSYKHSLKLFLPATGSQRGFQAVWVPNHFVQNTNYLLKLWPFTTFFLPTV